MKHYIKLMRVHHYIKNLLIFAALGCSGQFFDLKKLFSCTTGFAAFCLISSVVYILNDIRDAEKDRLHPTKRIRPIAAGTVNVRHACVFSVVLLGLSVILGLSTLRPVTTFVLLLYFILNLFYSFGLKNVPILDLAILVSGFLLRIVYGALITNIKLSNWLYLTVIVSAFYFALGKRKNELLSTQGTQTRKVLNSYPAAFLNNSMIMCLTLTMAFYALWSMDETTEALYHSDRLVFTVPLVLLILMKYTMNLETDSDGDPVEVLLHDKTLLILCFVYLAFMFFILYT